MGSRIQTMTGTTQTDVRCYELNLQHSRAAKANLMKIVAEEEIDIIFIQEPCTIKDKVIGIPTKYTTFTAGVGRPRAAIVVTNKEIDTTMICQLSDTDTVTVEVIKDSTKIIAISMYYEKEIQIESDLEKWNGSYYTLISLEYSSHQTPTPDLPYGTIG
jgi:hypothetical protein